ncbi:MAG: DUF3892 domain-containing protein [Clostridiaceae bacterium]|nr:DUF3892 domain-containing protein [Eubacteriales bacterium]
MEHRDLSFLPMAAMTNVPTPRADAREIVALVKEGGRTTGYKLSDGAIVEKPEGVRLAKEGRIKGVGVATRNGSEYLKSLPDGREDNNLDGLPTLDK